METERTERAACQLMGVADARFSGGGARSSDLDKRPGRLTTCPHAN